MSWVAYCDYLVQPDPAGKVVNAAAHILGKDGAIWGSSTSATGNLAITAAEAKYLVGQVDPSQKFSFGGQKYRVTVTVPGEFLHGRCADVTGRGLIGSFSGTAMIIAIYDENNQQNSGDCSQAVAAMCTDLTSKGC